MTIPNLVLVGLNHLSAPVAGREKASVPRAGLAGALAELQASAGASEVLVLSTCSRLELVAVSEDTDRTAGALRGWLVPRGADAAALYERRGADALRHLFRVASGLDSWILGETEILGQVKDAYRAAVEARATGPVLNRAVQRAIEAGKTIRARTGIQNGIHSIGGAAALMARRIFGDARSGRIVVFGAGEAAEAVARHLAAKDFDRLTVANRTVEKAEPLARELGGEAVSIEAGLALLSKVEVAVFSAAASEPILTAERLRRTTAGRSRPLFVIDLGLPRNVDPLCGSVDGAYLYDLDDLKAVVRETCERKAAERDRAEVLAALAASECAADLAKAARLGSARACELAA